MPTLHPRAQTTASRPSFSSTTGLAVASTLGANFQILPCLAAGVFVEGASTTVEQLEDTRYGALTIDFGLTVEFRLP